MELDCYAIQLASSGLELDCYACWVPPPPPSLILVGDRDPDPVSPPPGAGPWPHGGRGVRGGWGFGGLRDRGAPRGCRKGRGGPAVLRARARRPARSSFLFIMFVRLPLMDCQTLRSPSDMVIWIGVSV